jgi:hypothetical protein
VIADSIRDSFSSMFAPEPLRRFASTISNESWELVDYTPDPLAQPAQCFQNVSEKVCREGGRPIFGWVFLFRNAPYLIAMHHAVWRARDSDATVDITPFHPNTQPYCHAGKVVFLLDGAAEPRKIGLYFCRLPSKFFPLTDDPELLAGVKKERIADEAVCQKFAEDALAAHLSSQRN